MGISKRFVLNQALDDVGIDLFAGEVHALLGENGAGKSTIVGVLNGGCAQDTGSVSLFGQDLPRGKRPAEISRRIATVYQDLMLVPSMTGLQNIALALGLAANRATREAVEAVREQFGVDVRLDLRVGELDLAERQRIEIIRALCQKPAVLLLDEPTGYLAVTDVPPFLEEVRRLAATGLAVMLITHRLEEVQEVADRVTILRRGKVVATYQRGHLPSNSELAMQMVGARVVEPSPTHRHGDEVVLQAKNLTVARDRGSKAVDGLNLELHRSEVLGIAGVDGNGQIELLQALAGLRRVQEGDVLYEGQRITQLEYPIRLSRGIHFVSGDRRRYGIIPGFSIGEHFSYVLGDGITPRLPAVLAKYNVVPADPRVGGDRLSGGNQQKMLLARVCERRPRVLLLAYPTTGLDVQASIRVREFLLDLAMEGAAIVIASSDLDELMSVCHRIVVMDRGRIAGEQASGEFDRWQLAEWFTGGGVRSANTSLS